jgi:hypothetical protein
VYPNFHFPYLTGKRALNFFHIDVEVEGLQAEHGTAVPAVERKRGQATFPDNLKYDGHSNFPISLPCSWYHAVVLSLNKVACPLFPE